MKQEAFKKSAQAIAIIAILRNTKEGDVVTWQKMAKAMPPGTTEEQMRGASSTARKELLNTDRIHFDAVPGVGLKRLSPAEAVAASGRDIIGIRRKSRRALRKLAAVDRPRLSPDDQMRADVNATVLAIAQQATSGPNRKLIAQPTNNTTESVAATVAALLG